MKNQSYSTVDEYITTFPKEIQVKLSELRRIVKTAAPDSVESISYKMPSFSLSGRLVYFAAFKSHIGFYPMPRGIQEFEKELSAYQSGKGTLQFPMNRPLPKKLIAKIVKFRVAENLEKARGKSKKSAKAG
jgi:uncharacterized protein YdhG (YjbR/CyaY superfamily)